MVELQISKTNPLSAKTQSLAYFVHYDSLDSESLQEFSKNLFPNLKTYVKELDFNGQLGKIVSIPVTIDKRVMTVFIVGLGSPIKKHIPMEQFRRALGLLVKTMQSRKLTSCTIVPPASSLLNATPELIGKEIAIISSMASYRFDEFITDKQRIVPRELTLDIYSSAKDAKSYQAGIDQGAIIAKAIDKVRHWVDLPPAVCTPTALADYASDIAKRGKLKLTVFNEPDIIKMGMGGLAGVSAGSEQDCKLVILEYKTEKKNAPTIAFVGKGITFDSGGLSLKPASSMETMKEDMSGAAAVIGTMEIVAQLKPEINIVALAPIAENLPSGKATKPGDIVRFYNGKTAEVKNTDAEGRLILADALSYAVKHYKPDAIIDLATLTGACAYALGPFFSGMMGKDEELLNKVREASRLSGDRVWELPFDDDYKPAIVSEVADLCNSGKNRYRAGAITAGFFLYNFVDNTPWVHLDIAGTAFDVPDISYYSTGATGVGVRLLTELAMNWK